jgi:tyrosine-specific transport protein
MTSGAFLILETNLWMPPNSNIITMARNTLGPVGRFIAWATYFLLLYSLVCAYIAGGTDLLHNLFLATHFDLPIWLSSVLFTVLFGAIVSLGIHAVDYCNRGLMFIKLSAYALIVILLMPFISTVNLASGSLRQITSTTAIMVTLTSFGFATMVPSLRIYFKDDTKRLKKAIMIGSLIPLVCYIFWDAVIMGIIPLDGANGLAAILHSSSSTSDMVNTLNSIANSNSITFFVKLFTSICVVTSFLGVSLCLADFLSDGLRIEKSGRGNKLIHLFVFAPPLTIVLFYPNAFIKALEYAGIYCTILLMLLPAWMTWNGRYRKRLAKGFKVPGGKPFLGFIILVSIVLIANSLVSIFNSFTFN